jgi:hypothetical protein
MAKLYPLGKKLLIRGGQNQTGGAKRNSIQGVKYIKNHDNPLAFYDNKMIGCELFEYIHR